MDFSKLDVHSTAQHTFRFEVLHPVTGDGTGAFIDVYGAESDPVRKYTASQLRQLQKQEFENSRTRKPKYVELSELEDRKLENALVRIAGWENVKWGKEEMVFTSENARKLLMACPWLSDQIVEHSDELGNFLKA
ncbi:hypothetical protein BKK54_11105 [Rodentibacter genomosp. 1]|uniref:Uncharacterized protein n=1 Tax=Rodentibacter genomosp. 1 TaxID=1908264 RepID=A0A1V3J0E6_9PAST|nr:hypothetical protein [Rodentibacter genomosp. 1]OOF48301.1 hypothetical protein BKK54_11105 [Rodentibacter genomosp. 1]